MGTPVFEIVLCNFSYLIALQFCVLLLQSYTEKFSTYILFVLIAVMYTVCRISRTNNTNFHMLIIFMVYFAIFTGFHSHVTGYLGAHDMYPAYYSR